MPKNIVKKFLRWSFISYAFSVLNAVISVCMVSVAVSFYGFEGLGVITTYLMFTASNGFLSLLDFGLSPIITRKISISSGSGSLSSGLLCSKYLSIVSIHCFSVGMLIGVPAIIFITFTFFFGGDENIAYYAALLFITGIQLFNFFSLKIHEAYKNILLSKLTEFFTILSFLAGLYALHNMGYSEVYFVFIIVFVNIVVFLFNLYIYIDVYKAGLKYPKKFSMRMMKGQADLFKLSLSSMFYAQYPKWIILFFLGTYSLGIYESIIRIPRFIKFSISAFSSVVIPLLSTRSTSRSVCYIFEKSYLIIPSCVCVLVFIIIQKPEKILSLYLDDTSHSGIFVIALLWSVMAIFLSLGAPFLIAAGKGYSFLRYNNLLITFSSFFATLPLIYLFGLEGVFFGQIIGVLFIPHTLKNYSIYTGCHIWTRALKIVYICFVVVLLFSVYKQIGEF